MEAVRTENLTKKYKDVTAVDGLTLKIEEGELFSLLGVNGSGKTTTIKMLSALTEPTSGSALLLGKTPQKAKEFIGVSPQETAVAKGLTVKENLEFMCKINGFSKEKAKRRTDEIIADFALEEVKNKKASKLSGGFQRRLSIAMALVTEPKILFLDEPTLGLDVIARRELWALIKLIGKNMTVILTTHYLEEAENISDRIGIMKKGKLAAVGTVDELLKQAGCEKFEDAFVSIAAEGII